MAFQKLTSSPPVNAVMTGEDGRVSSDWARWFSSLSAKTTTISDETYDPGSIAAGGALIVNLAFPGARPGDFTSVSFDQAGSGVYVHGQATTDSVSVIFHNTSGAAVDLPSGTLRVMVRAK